MSRDIRCSLWLTGYRYIQLTFWSSRRKPSCQKLKFKKEWRLPSKSPIICSKYIEDVALPTHIIYLMVPFEGLEYKDCPIISIQHHPGKARFPGSLTERLLVFEEFQIFSGPKFGAQGWS